MTTDQPTDHDEIAELLSLYALDASSPDEARLVERHVARCTPCHAELQSLLATSDALAWAPEQVAMPASVRSSVLAAVGAERGAPGEVTAPVKVKRRRARQFRLAFAMPMAACFALVVVALVVQTIRLDERRSDTSDTSMARTMTGSSHVVRISTRGALDGVHAEYADVHGVGMIVTKGLPAPPDGYSYRVWGVTASHDMHPMGALAPHAGRDRMALQALDAPRRGEVATIEITLEPDGSAMTEPSGPVVGRAEMV